MDTPVPPFSKWERMLGATESPIERKFLAAFCECAQEAGYRVWKTPSGNDTIAIRPQRRMYEYRPDFVISFLFFKCGIDLIIECDGHEFHEKTEFQVAKDKKRDRRLTALGYRVLRFTGSEINRNAKACADEVLAIIMDFQTTAIWSRR